MLALTSLQNIEVKAVDSVVGEVTEKDIQLAKDTNCIVLAFGVRCSDKVQRFAVGTCNHITHLAATCQTGR